jgi:hypothetical protein
MRRALFLAAFGLLFAVAGVSLTSAYFSDTLSFTQSFIASIPDASPTPSATASATATTSATVTPRSSPTITATRTVLGTRTTTPTTTAMPRLTATPADCDRTAKLKFDPDTLQLGGVGPFAGSISIENTDRHATAGDVVIGLLIGQGAQFLSSIEFANGQVWQIDGAPGFTLYAAGDIPPGATMQITFTIDATGAWVDETPPLTAQIVLGIASANCVAHPESALAKIVLHREPDNATATRTARATVTRTPTARPSDTPPPAISATVSPVDTATAIPESTETPAVTATDTPPAVDATDTPTGPG